MLKFKKSFYLTVRVRVISDFKLGTDRQSGNILGSKSLDPAQPWIVSKQRRKNWPDKEQSIFTFDVIKIICQLWVDHMAFKLNKAPVAKSSKPVNVGF